MVFLPLFILGHYFSFKKCVSDPKHIVVFPFIIASFQVPSFWGAQALAYHQVIPFTLVPFIILVLLKKKSQIILSEISLTLIAFLLAMICGFSYVSGALLMTGVVSWIWVLWLFDLKIRNHLSLIRLATLTLVTFIAFIAHVQAIGPEIHLKMAPAYPWEPRFWGFIIGLSSKALGNYEINSNFFYHDFLSFIFLLIVPGIILIIKAILLQKEDKSNIYIFCTIGSLFLGSIFFAAAVSYGRSVYLPAEAFWESIQLAKRRFHFFGLTPLIPWIVLLYIQIAIELKYFFAARCVYMCALAVPILFIIGLINSDFRAFNYSSYFRGYSIQKSKGLSCLRQKMISNQAIICPEIYPADLRQAIKKSIASGLSFTNSLYNRTYHKRFTSKDMNGKYTKLRNIKLLNEGDNILLLASTSDPQIILYTGWKGNACNVRLEAMYTGGKTSASLYFLKDKSKHFSANNVISKRRSLKNESPLVFSVNNIRADILRLDPSNAKEIFQIDHIDIWAECRFIK